jgi:hypothetical protein
MKSILPVVDYELAISLKMMGFSEPVYYQYKNSKLMEDEDSKGFCNYNGLDSDDTVSAPFLQEVQTWLSRKKRVDVLVYRDMFFNQADKYYGVVIRRKDNMIRETGRVISSNLALEAGVKTAVKLLCKKRKRK